MVTSTSARAPGSDEDPGARRRSPTTLLDALPWWLPPLTLVLLTRLVDAWMLVRIGADQVALEVGQGFYLVEPVPADPGYFDLVTNWDGQWYRTIAEQGYPTELPRYDGEVQQNPWAFFPALPALARLLMTLTGTSFGVAASTVSLVASTLALVLLYRLLARHGGRYVALVTTTAISAAPAGAVLQTSYTEGLSLLLIVLVLDALSRRRYGAVAAWVVLLALTRPVVLALVPVLLVHAWWRWRAEGPLPHRELLRLGGLVVLTGLSFGLWPLVAAVVTGEPNAYLLTQGAWVLTEERSWQTWLGQLLGVTGATLAADVAVVVLLVLAIVLQPATRVWTPELRAWAVSYGAFLLVTARPTPSITRYALLLLVVWWPFPTLGRRWHRAGQAAVLGGVLVVGLLLQHAWLESSFLLTMRRTAYP